NYFHLWILLALLNTSRHSTLRFHFARFLQFAALLLTIASSLLLFEDRSLLLASFFHLNNQDPVALKFASLAKSANPFDSLPLSTLNDIYLSQQNLPAAEATLRKLIQTKKNFAPFYTELAKLLLLQKKYPQAENLLNSAIRLDPYCALHA